MKIVVNIIGGLGNQMFQYAFAYSVSRKINQPFELDIGDIDTHWHPYELGALWGVYQLNAFQIEEKFTSYETRPKKRNLLNRAIKKLKFIKRKFLLKGYYQEPHYNFDKNVFNVKGDTYFIGYWQSEYYFKEYRDDLLKQFTLKGLLHKSSQHYEKEIFSSKSASLHVRRGDYVKNKATSDFHGTCSLEYYQKAVGLIIQSNPDTCFYIFSDDLDWTKKNLNFIENKMFVELDNGIPDCEEMYLMSLCQNNIIANSSFSWWGAWLNQNNEKVVIAPKKWFNDSLYNTTDVIPDDWIRI